MFYNETFAHRLRGWNLNPFTEEVQKQRRNSTFNI